MKLFSEKVEPTFTSSNLNILGVKNFKEVFVDVFEFEINGKKFIAEKVSDHNGLPVVNIPIVLEGNEYTAPFVLRRGQVEILFNKENAVFVKPVLEEVQELIEQYTDEEQVKVQTLIKSSIDELSNKLTASIEDRAANIESLVNEKIINLTTNTIPNVFLKGMNNVDSTINTEEVNSRIEAINETVKAEKNKIYADIETIASEATQLSEKIDKNTNRALSRIGNVKVQLETTITDAINSLEDKLKSIESKISDYYTSKIAEINESVKDITENNKEHIIDLINESKQTLLEEISKIKRDIPDIVIENEDGKKGVNVSGIKAELEKIIGTKFTTEIGALKRLIEMSSGGGSVAKQFANGGTMDGTLNVTGKYLSGGIDIATLFSGGGGGDDIEVNTLVRSSSANWNKGYTGYNSLTALSGNWQTTYTTVSSNSGNWDSAYDTSTVYQVNSGTYATIDFVDSKFFPSSGGVITGETRFDSNVTIFGNLTTVGTTTFANTVFSVTSALSVVHVGAGPAIWVGNNGSGDIASFYDIDQDVEILHVGGINSTYPNVGIKTSTPNKTFTVVGEISSTSDITTSGKILLQGDGGSDQWNSSYTTVQTNSATWDYQGTDLKALSSNWQSTYTVTNTYSGDWNNAYSVSMVYQSNSASYINADYVVSNFLPLTGGNITGDLSVDTNTFYVDTTNDRVGIGTTTPTAKLEVNGTTIIQDDATFYGDQNTMPNQTLDAGDGSVITKGIGDVRYLDHSPVVNNTLTHTYEQFEDFDKYVDTASDGSVFVAAASGSFTPGVSYLFGNTFDGITQWYDNDRYTWNGAITVRGPTASRQALYYGLGRVINFTAIGTIDFTTRVMILSTGMTTQGFFKVGPIPWGGTGAGSAALLGGLTYNPRCFGSQNLFIAVRASSSTTVFTALSDDCNFLDTGFDFSPYFNKWVNITQQYRVISGAVNMRYIITRENITLYDSNNLNLNNSPFNTWPQVASLYGSGASRKIGFCLGVHTYGGVRSQMFIDYVYDKITPGSSWTPPSNWNSLRF